jgi:hypothetical protein
MSRALRTQKHRSMVQVVLDYLKTGKSITAYEAVDLWGELNLRNKISELRRHGWQIHSDEVQAERGGKFKKYYLNMEHPRGGEDE